MILNHLLQKKSISLIEFYPSHLLLTSSNNPQLPITILYNPHLIILAFSNVTNEFQPTKMKSHYSYPTEILTSDTQGKKKSLLVLRKPEATPQRIRPITTIQ